MSFLSSLHETRASWSGPFSLKDPALNALFGVGRRTDAGIVVTDDLAMMCSAVFAAVNLLASDIAKAPLNLLKRTKEGGSEHYTASKTYYLLKTEANPEMGAMVFRQTLMAHALTLGGGYAEIERDGFGRPVALWPITPDRICTKRDDRTGDLFYLVDQRDKFAPEDILHIHGLGWDGTTGYALLNQARQAVGLMLALERFSAAFFGNGSTPGGVVSVDAPLADEEEVQQILSRLERLNSGVDRAFRWLVLGSGYKATPWQVNNKDSELNILRDKQVEEVSRFYRIPLHKLNNLTRATFSNVEQQDLEYYKGPILDWMTLWEQECHRKLIPRLERTLFYFKHNANVFLRGDMAGRSQAFGLFRDKGIMCADEIRELEDLGPQPDGQGRVYYMQSAQSPQEMLAALAQAQLDKLKAETAKIQQPEPAPAPAPAMDEDEMAPMRARLAAAETLAEEWRQKAEAETATAAELRGARDAATAEVAARRTAEAEKQAALDALRAELAQTGIATAEQRAELRQAQDALAQATADLAAADAARITLEAAMASADAQAQQARSGVEAAEVALASLRADHAALQAAAAELQQTVSAKDTALAEAEARAREAAAHAIILADQVADAAARAVRAESEAAIAKDQGEVARRAVHRQAAEQQARELEAHRALYAHIMRGAIERETDRARRAQQTPEKLRQWIESWYDGHAELMRAALLPAVRVHCAWIGSTDDPGELVTALVAEHVATSRRQLATVVQGDAEALAGSLAGLLRRWETERVTVIPAILMEREVAYVRSKG